MIPVTQTKMVVKNSAGEFVVHGNCYAAAIASILELPITEVPNVETLFHIENSYWAEVTHTWLVSKGYDILTDNRFMVFHPELAGRVADNHEELRAELKDRYYLVSGDSPRGVMHICIFQNGVMVHDPHPTREGILNHQYFETIDLLNPPTNGQ